MEPLLLKIIWEVRIMNETFMKEKPIFPLLLGMGMPMVLSMLVNSLYNIVDSYFVARISENAMEALSLVFPIQNFINAMAIGFGVGINALIATARGAGKENEARRAATQGVVLSVIHGIILSVICIVIMPKFLGDSQAIRRSSGTVCATHPSHSCFHRSSWQDWPSKKDLSGSGADEGVHDCPAWRLHHKHYPGSDFNLWTGILSENGNLRRGNCHRCGAAYLARSLPCLLFPRSGSGKAGSKV